MSSYAQLFSKYDFDSAQLLEAQRNVKERKKQKFHGLLLIAKQKEDCSIGNQKIKKHEWGCDGATNSDLL